MYYHGTPITPNSVLHTMNGRNFCVPFISPYNLKTCLKIGGSIMADSGAFSAYTRNITIDFNEYEKWLSQWMVPPHWAIIPDVINGSVEDNINLAKKWNISKNLSAFVWHLHEPIDHLLWVIDNYDRVCFGSSGQFWDVSSSAWASRIDEAWNDIAKRGYRPWVHMLRAAKQAREGNWPFASCDSTNIARNHSGSKQSSGFCAPCKADYLEGKRPSGGWIIKPTQKEIF